MAENSVAKKRKPDGKALSGTALSPAGGKFKFFFKDLLKQGLFVKPETNRPVTSFDVTAGNYNMDELPKPSDDINVLREDLREFGYCLVKDALNTDQLAAVRKRFVEQAAAERRAGVGYYGQESMDENRAPTNQLVYALYNKGEVFRKLIEFSDETVQHGPMIEQLVKELLGPGFLLNTAAGWIAGKNGSPQTMHTGQIFVPKPWPNWPFECLVAYMLDDCHERNGGTLIIPRSHRILTEAGDGPAPKLPPTVNAVGPAGTALVLEGRTVHGTGVNRTDEPRNVVIFPYHRVFMRTQEKFDVSVNREVYENASPKLLQILGFTVTPYGGNLGGVEANLTGPGGVAVAPLRDNYMPVSELGPSSTSAELDAPFSVRGTVSYKDSRRSHARMRETDQALVRRDHWADNQVPVAGARRESKL